MPNGWRFIAVLVFTVIPGVHTLVANDRGFFWNQLSPETVPPSRWSAGALIYDSKRDVLTMFGGISDDVPVQNDTWEWDGSNWTERTAPVVPGARRNHATAYDSVRERAYVISGLGFNNQPPSFNLFRYDDMWAWDGETWSEIVASPRPAPRQGSSAVFDELRQEVVLFGGRCSGGTDCSDTWTFDGTSWTQRFPATVPTARESHSLVYDSRRGRVVMFGGSSDPFTFLDDTWEWDGTDWNEVPTASAPPARVGAAAAFDPSTGFTILYGGASPGVVYDDTWVFDGATWTALAIPAPPRRQAVSMAHRPGDGIILFGGLDSTVLSARINHADTWRLTSGDTRPPRVICPAAPAFLLHAKDRVVSAQVVDEPGGSGAFAATVSVSADTAAVGLKSAEITGSDWAGHPTTAACPYFVTYHFKDFDPPASGGGVLNAAVAGREILFKWGLFDVDGAPVADLSTATMTVSTLPCPLGDTPDLPPVHSRLRNLGGGFYKINWATPKAYGASCKTVRFDFGEGITRDALFQFVQ